MRARQGERQADDDLDDLEFGAQSQEFSEISSAARNRGHRRREHPVGITPCDADAHLADVYAEPNARAHESARDGGTDGVDRRGDGIETGTAALGEIILAAASSAEDRSRGLRESTSPDAAIA